MLDDRPAKLVTVAPRISGTARAFAQKLGEPRVLGWIAVAFVLTMWEVVVVAARLNPIYFAAPEPYPGRAGNDVQTGDLFVDLLATLGRIFGGFADCTRSWNAARDMDGDIGTRERNRRQFHRCSVSFTEGHVDPPADHLARHRRAFMLAISALGAFFPIVINTVLGIRQCDPGLILAARDLGASNPQVIRMVLLPSAVPRYSPASVSVSGSQSS